jgi:hypothetical protein
VQFLMALSARTILTLVVVAFVVGGIAGFAIARAIG